MASIVPTSALSAAVTSASSAAAAPPADYFISALQPQSPNMLVPLRSVDPTDLKNPDSPVVATRSIDGVNAKIHEDDEESEVGSKDGSEREGSETGKNESEATEQTKKSIDSRSEQSGKVTQSAQLSIKDEEPLQQNGVQKKSAEIEFDGEQKQQQRQHQQPPGLCESECKIVDNGMRAVVAEMETETKNVGDVIIATVGGGPGRKEEGKESVDGVTKELVPRNEPVSAANKGDLTLMEVDGVKEKGK